MEEQSHDNQTWRTARRRQRPFEARLLEDESLRQSLNDGEARQLLRWATGHLATAATQTAAAPEASAESHLARVTDAAAAAMLAVSRLVGVDSAETPPGDIHYQIFRCFIAATPLTAAAYDPATVARIRQLAHEFAELTSEQRFNRLFNLIQGGAAAQDNP